MVSQAYHKLTYRKTKHIKSLKVQKLPFNDLAMIAKSPHNMLTVIDKDFFMGS